jgi:peptide/nickel transport system substrate-binding protein
VILTISSPCYQIRTRLAPPGGTLRCKKTREVSPVTRISRRHRGIDEQLADRGLVATRSARHASSLPWPSSSPAYEADKSSHYTFDLDKASALLSDTGVTNLETTLLLNTGLREPIDFAPIYQADLASIGVRLAIQVVEVAAWINAVNALQYNAVYASTGSLAQLRSPRILFGSGPVWGPTQNNTGFCSDQYTMLANQADLEVDPAKQKQIYSQLNDLLLDQTFVTTLAPNPPRETFRAAVKNITHSEHEGFVFNTTTLAS